MRIVSSSFTASDRPEATTAGRVVSLRSITVHHGFRCKEASCAGKQDINHTKQHHTTHCWLPATVMYLTNSANAWFSFQDWLIRSTPILLLKNVQIYITRQRRFQEMSSDSN